MDSKVTGASADSPYPTALDGAGVYRWACVAAAALGEHRAEINAMNVFPVPDSDTGSNMAHTMAAAVEEVHRRFGPDPDVESLTLDDVAGALAAGSVRGARGNSGVVLSQVWRGIAEATAGGRVDGNTISRALTLARAMVDRAIADPVEGTVITVLRSAAVAAEDAVNHQAPLYDVVQQATTAAKTALQNTPSQLSALREAGVVDAGGAGFVVLLSSLLSYLEGTPVETHPTIVDDLANQPEMEVMAYLESTGDRQIDLDALRTALEGMGNSLIIAPEGHAAQTHIHTTQPGEVVELLYTSAPIVSGLRLEVLPPAPATSQPERVLVAVVPEGPLVNLFEDAGVRVLSPSNNTSPTATFNEDAVNAFAASLRAEAATEVVLIPNGVLSRRDLISAELACTAAGKTLSIVHSDCPVRGIAALAVHDPASPFAVDCFSMGDAASSMRVARIVDNTTPNTYASYADWQYGAFNARVFDDAPLATATTVQQCLLDTCTQMLQRGGELVTLLQREPFLDDNDVAELQQQLNQARDGLDVGEISVVSVHAEGIRPLVEIGVE